MNKDWPIPSQLKLVSTIPFPEHLFVCFTKLKDTTAAALHKHFSKGTALPDPLADSFNQHIAYNYDLGEKGLIWEAGPTSDFSEMLSVFSAPNLEAAMEMVKSDPFYQDRTLFDDWWFEWDVHVPLWKIDQSHREMMEDLLRNMNIVPNYPPGVQPNINEIRVEPVTPPRLFGSISRAKAEDIKQLEVDQQAGKPIPDYFVNHAFNRLGPGGTVQMGYDWEAGPSSDQYYDLTIMSVGSMEMARLLRENDPLSQHGLFYEHRYFEWNMFWPFQKASPRWKPVLGELLAKAGVTLP